MHLIPDCAYLHHKLQEYIDMKQARNRVFLAALLHCEEEPPSLCLLYNTVGKVCQ